MQPHASMKDACLRKAAGSPTPQHLTGCTAACRQMGTATAQQQYFVHMLTAALEGMLFRRAGVWQNPAMQSHDMGCPGLMALLLAWEPA